MTWMPERLLSPVEVARMFRVSPKTVTRWADAGDVNSLRTAGGHRRFRHSDVLEMLRNGRTAARPAAAERLTDELELFDDVVAVDQPVGAHQKKVGADAEDPLQLVAVGGDRRAAFGALVAAAVLDGAVSPQIHWLNHS